MDQMTGRTQPAVVDTPIDAAQSWARERFAPTTTERVANHIWAKTFRLQRLDGQEAFLKVLPRSNERSNLAIAAIARHFEPNVPAILDVAPEDGFFLFRGHKSEEFSARLDSENKRALLALYGAIQGKAHAIDEICGNLPQASCVTQFEIFLTLLQEAADRLPTEGREGNPFLYMRRETVRSYLGIFRAAEDLFREFLVKGDALAPTLNHCDLRAKNIARHPDGELRIFDWDDAVCGPPGLSLHGQFSGCMRVLAAFDTASDRRRSDKKALEAYVDALSEHGPYSADDLRAALPATACAGVFRYIESFDPYPTESRSLQKSIARNVRKRLSDLMDVMGVLARRSRRDVSAISKALEDSGRSGRARQIAPKSAKTASGKTEFERQLTKNEPPEVFPAISISDREKAKDALSSDNRKLALELFRRHGGLMIENAFGPSRINAFKTEFDALSQEHEAAIRRGGARRVGNQRFMLSLELTGAFAAPDLVASPFVLPILQDLLTRDAILGSFTAVASQPGAKDQSLHRDNPPLFEEASGFETPSFCIALIVPLIALDETTGATRIIKGSHKRRTRDIDGMAFQNPTVSLGSCYLMDSRLFHQGMANRSDQVRPILSLVYQRPWYRDHKNFKKQSPLMVSDEKLASFPSKMQKLVSWAGDPN